MDQMTVTLLMAVPAILIILAAIAVGRAGRDQTAPRRLLLLFEIATLACLAVIAGVSWIPSANQLYAIWIIPLLIPAVAGMVILILLHLPSLRNLNRSDKAIVISLGLAIIGCLTYFLIKPYVLMEILPGAIVVTGCAWLMTKKPSSWIWILGGIVIGGMFLLNGPLDRFQALLPRGLETVFGIWMLLMPALAVSVSALFFYSGMQRMAFPPSEMDRGSMFTSRVDGVLRLLTAALLLGLIVYSAFWASVWDQTSDGLGGVMISSVSTIAAVAIGMVMSFRAVKWNRLAGVLFMAGVPVLIGFGFRLGWGVKFPVLTENRAARITQALERFHTRENRYPNGLAELAPRDLLIVPQPVMFRGEAWCYTGNARAFSLAAFSHEYFGLPVSLHVYASAGDLGDQPLPCQERLADMQARYDWTHTEQFTTGEMPPPTPAPLPEGVQPVVREVIQPLLAARNILPGDWSADGQLWFFRLILSGQKEATLHFYNAATRTICDMPNPLPYDSYSDMSPVWLSDGRLLSQEGNDGITRLEPCGGISQPIDLPTGVQITQVSAKDPATGRLLLQSQEAYWLLHPGDQGLQRVSGVQPVQYDAHWDRAAWSLDGRRLVIAKLNTREPKDGITLFLLDGRTGKLLSSQVMDQAFEQSAPFIEWMTVDILLMHGPQSLIQIDFRTDPPSQVDVMKELFNLALKVPEQVSSDAAISTKDGQSYHILVRANHSGDKKVYVYHAESGQVSHYQPQDQGVFIFPDGQWTLLPPIESSARKNDLVELYWIDSDRPGPVSIQVAGHLPRGYQMLDVEYLAEKSALLLGSSNGVSMVSVPGGEMINFWRVGSGLDTSPWLQLSPDEKTALFISNGDGIFRIPIDR
jgi:hypothetical protein